MGIPRESGSSNCNHSQGEPIFIIVWGLLPEYLVTLTFWVERWGAAFGCSGKGGPSLDVCIASAFLLRKSLASIARSSLGMANQRGGDGN